MAKSQSLGIQDYQRQSITESHDPLSLLNKKQQKVYETASKWAMQTTD